MNAKAVVPLVLAVVLGLVAAVLVRNAIAHKSVVAPTGNLISVVVAKADFEPGHEITTEDLAVSKIPADVAPGQVFSDPTQLIGRVVTTQLIKGETILEPLLAPAGTGGGLQALIPPGMRAMTMQVTEYSGVGGMLRPGCRVDILTVMHNEKTNEVSSRTILQNILITAVGHNVSPNPPAPTADGQPAPPPSNAITLLLTPHQAQMLQLALLSSQSWFALRSTRDGKQLPLEGTTLAELRGEENKDAVADATPVAPTPNNVAPSQMDDEPATIKHTVQVIRSGVESQVTFVVPNPRASASEAPDLAPAIPEH